MIEEEIKFRLPWPVICRLACKACIMGLTFEEVCQMALRGSLQDYLSSRTTKA